VSATETGVFTVSLFHPYGNKDYTLGIKFERRPRMYERIPSYSLPGGRMEVADIDDLLVNDALGSVHAADSSGSDEELETGDAKAWNFPTRED
jgi:hypothetical protein